MKRFIFLFVVIASLVAEGQETLDTILDRGYVAEWLVCGPFVGDVVGGIVGGVGAGTAPLGSMDYLC